MTTKSFASLSMPANSIAVARAPALLDVRGPHPPGPGANLYGTDQDDTIYGNYRANELHGLAGNDLFKYSIGGDAFFGDSGNDTVDYSAAPSAINVDLVRDQHGAAGAGASGAAAGDTYDQVENVIGSGAADTIRGDNGANVIVAGAGADYIEGRGGDDHLAGGKGADYILGGDGNDTIWAGQLYQTDYDSDTIFGGNGNDRITGSHGNNFLNGDDGNDTVFGFGGDDTVNGGNGDDLLYGDDAKPMNGVADGSDAVAGGLGNDTIFGGGGKDYLFGGSGNDTIYGEKGDDLILGGPGADRLSGGYGTNTFVFTAPTDGGDHIVDFQHSYIGYTDPWSGTTVHVNTSDKIAIDRAGFGLSDSFTINNATFQSGDHIVGKNFGPMFFYNTHDHTLSFDSNGILPGGETVLATFDNGQVISASDFLLI